MSDIGTQHYRGKPGGLSAKDQSRLRWTPKLHDVFVEAVEELGGPFIAKPKDIYEMMRVSAAEVTTSHIKSHLQKYRISLRIPQSLGPPTYNSGPPAPVKLCSNDWRYDQATAPPPSVSWPTFGYFHTVPAPPPTVPIWDPTIVTKLNGPIGSSNILSNKIMEDTTMIPCTTDNATAALLVQQIQQLIGSLSQGLPDTSMDAKDPDVCLKQIITTVPGSSAETETAASMKVNESSAGTALVVETPLSGPMTPFFSYNTEGSDQNIAFAATGDAAVLEEEDAVNNSEAQGADTTAAPEADVDLLHQMLDLIKSLGPYLEDTYEKHKEMQLQIESQINKQKEQEQLLEMLLTAAAQY